VATKKILGKVASISLGRSVGKVYILETLATKPYPLGNKAQAQGQQPHLGAKLIHSFTLYWDTPANAMIDPTEMVRRNWLIGLFEFALREQKDVQVYYKSDSNALVTSVMVPPL
jgi:hypothetical protein